MANSVDLDQMQCSAATLLVRICQVHIFSYFSTKTCHGHLLEVTLTWRSMKIVKFLVEKTAYLEQCDGNLQI